MPVFYKKEISRCDPGKSDAVRLKLFSGSDWIWLDVHCRHQDIRYIRKKLATAERISCPALERKGRNFSLRFAIERDVADFSKTATKILSVDLGITKDAVCSVMRPDGTVAGRRFISFPAEKDRMWRVLGRIRRISRKYGSGHCENLWRIYRHFADRLSILVMRAITDYAIQEDVDAVVFEYLDIRGKKRGSLKQRLSLWRKNDIQARCRHRLHENGIRFSRVCPYNTSRLAFDGTGKVLRGKEADLPYGRCVFTTGKRYDCDLNASYNIGARYYLREMASENRDINLPKTSQRTWSHLWNLKPFRVTDHSGNLKVA